MEKLRKSIVWEMSEQLDPHWMGACMMVAFHWGNPCNDCWVCMCVCECGHPL